MYLADQAMQKCKINIMGKLPFLMHIGLQIPHRWNVNIPTARTDALSCEYNPTFFMELTPDMRVFLMAHEIWHTAFMHQLRMGSRDPIIWNKAGDYVINYLLVIAGFTMPAIGVFDTRFKNMTTEQVYDILISENEPTDDFNDLMDLLLPGHGQIDTEGETTPTRAPTVTEIERMKQIVSRAIALTKMTSGNEAGDIPGEIIRALDALLNPILPWKQILARHLTAVARSGVSWKRPNKRFVPRAYLPSQFNKTLGHVTFAIDTSGSISNKQLREMLSEIESIRKKYKPETLTIIDCDSDIHHVWKIKPKDKILKLAFTGGGGTNFKPVEEYCDKNKTNLLIYFTDLEIHALGDITTKKRYSIIWINHGRQKLKGTVGVTIPYSRTA